MAFYPQFPPAAIYAYPMPFPNQEFYAMYPHGPGGQSVEGSTVFYENNNSYNNKKPGYNNRKESMLSVDSAFSEFSSASSRKTSQTSNPSISEEPLVDDIKEEMPPMEEPDDDLCKFSFQITNHIFILLLKIQ